MDMILNGKINRLAESLSEVESSLENLSDVDNFPVSYSLSNGTLDSGTINDVKDLYDSKRLTINEAATTPGFLVEFSFANVEKFNRIRMHIKYYGTGGETHKVKVQIWNYETESWTYMTTYAKHEVFQYVEMPIVSDKYISLTGEAKLKFEHDILGIVGHKIEFDYINLVYSNAGSKGLKGDKGDSGVTPVKGVDYDDGIDGVDGVNAYVYVAYASDDAGADFSLTPTDELKYRAEIHTTEEIATPQASDFASATWVKYIGDDGTGDASIDDESISADTTWSSEKVSSELASITQQGTIKGMAIKTQAEYDALPASKETDGIIYLIRG